MLDFFSWLFSSPGFMPHGHCYLWQPGTLWLNAGSDGLIAAAYFAIPLSLYSLVRRRVADIPFPGIILMFAAFILLCGSTHLMEIWTIWNPIYRLSGALKLLTGLVSLATTVALFRLMPLALQLRSPRELRLEVDARTAELAQANETLRRNVAELERQREEIQRTHRQRNESLALLATTLRSIGDAVISTDGGGRIQFMNAIAETLTGWQEQAARGRPLEDVFSIVNEQTREAVESPVAKVLKEGAIVGLANHTVLLARDGSEKPIEDSGAPIWEGGELKGVVLVFRDATAQRNTELALREADRRKDVFLAVLSHELRNPLAPIRNAASLLGKSNLAPEVLQRSHRIIQRQVQHMAALLDDLLDVSRITRGVFSLKKRYVDLRGLLSEAVETARPQIDRKQHVLHTQWPTEPVDIEADPVRLVQIISNLLTNAAKYTDPGGDIYFTAAIDADRLLISVRDTGIGIAAQTMARVFDMFSQIEPGQDRTEGGLGVGLALAKGLVELHGGQIEVRSAGIGHGSEFTVRIPCLHAATGSFPQLKAPNDGAADGRPLHHILVVDDNQDGAETLAMLLRLMGHEVLVAHSGLDALAMAEEHRPAIAILDIGMPGLSGYDIARTIRQKSWGERLTLIALTGWGQEEDRRQANAAGFDHHLTKPVDISELEQLFDSGALR